MNGFLLISGFAIAGGWMSGRGAESCLRTRAARIWPGFAVWVIVSALTAALAAGPDWLRYLRSTPIQS